jgi:hypothetical protein
MPDTPSTMQSAIEKAFYRIFRSIARVAIKYGYSSGAAGELLRRAFVDAAVDSIHQSGDKVRTSRICTLTGLYRKEVVRLFELPPVGSLPADERYNRSARVISGWTRDADFCTKRGKPAVLPMDGEFSFKSLVKRYSGDMTPKAVLEELQRLEMIEITSTRRVKLLVSAYLPNNSDADVVQILGTDVADLIDTIRYNVDAKPDERRFQRKVQYLHIPVEHVSEFKQLAATESQALLERLDQWLARRDTAPSSRVTPGARLGLGIYVAEHENEPPESESSNHTIGTLDE